MKKYTPIFISLIISLMYDQANAQWERLSDVYTTEVFVKESNIFIGTNKGEIFLSTDFGESWTSISHDSLPELFIDNIGLCKGNKLVCSCGRYVYTSSNWFDWEKVYEVQGNITAMAIQGDSIFIGVEGNGGVHVSDDAGSTWYDISGDLQNRYVTSLAVKDTTLILSRFGESHIYRYNHLLMSWIPFYEGTESDQIFALGRGNDFYAGGYYGIYKLENEEWRSVFYADGQVLDFAFQSSLIGAAGKDVYITFDSGLTWTTIDGTDMISWIKAIDFYDGYILAGNSTGLYRYPFWQATNTDEQLEEDLKIYPNPSNDMLYVKTTSLSDDKITVNLLSINGVLIHSKLYGKDTQNIQVDVSDQPSGLYILQVVQDGLSMTRKVIIE